MKVLEKLYGDSFWIFKDFKCFWHLKTDGSWRRMETWEKGSERNQKVVWRHVQKPRKACANLISMSPQ